jgi:hypothetical protein
VQKYPSLQSLSVVHGAAEHMPDEHTKLLPQSLATLQVLTPH